MKYYLTYFSDPPLIVKKIFPDFVWYSNINKILLTFDDGPNPSTTESILKLLNDYKIKSVFFCVGNNIQQYPKLAESILQEGHTIGNHTYNHSILTRLDNDEISLELMHFNNLLSDKFNYKVKYFRHPHGKFTFRTAKLINNNNLTNVMWSLLTFDYKNNLNIVKFAVTKYLKSNSIIVMHDSLKSKDIILDSIKFIAEEAENRGFGIGAPFECLK